MSSRPDPETGLELDALGADAVADVAGRAGAGRRAEVAVGAGEIVVAAVDRLDEEDGAVERVELEVLEILAEQDDVDRHRPARIFGAELVGGVDLRIELEIADQRLGAAGRQRRTAGSAT